jgi:rhamnose utilization protein RhaD (predicted bifunctional aldolase and dehydrogenase)/NAD(P)-dependent dehydrogenase (short-subunit alcohol dehydrogenase family)
LKAVYCHSNMKNLWNETDANACQSDLELRVYTSRLLGQNPELVLHGGGNTSVKIVEQDITGEETQVLYVKGSGWDLATIKAAGFAPVRLQRLLKLVQLEQMTDLAMARELKAAMLDPSAPAPSVEAILHALIPHKFVDHTHTDALITIMNTPNGLTRVQEIFGSKVMILPYVMPGFPLAKRALLEWQKQFHTDMIGMVLMNHGLFTFGETAKIAYDNMISLVTEAEKYLEQHNAWHLEPSRVKPHNSSMRLEIASLRANISKAAQQPMILTRDRQDFSSEFANRSDISQISQRGCATPDHVIRTKRLPMLGRDVTVYSDAYETYFKRHATTNLIMLDTAPRVVLDNKLGMLCAGNSIKEARITQDIYRQTMQMITRAEKLEAWQALPETDLFEMEYWDLEQAKLKSTKKSEFQGEVVLITGAASGIGKACAAVFLERGAAVIGLDLNAGITTTFSSQAFLGIECDITNQQAVLEALEQGIQTFGGLDMLILNAGIFPKSTPIATLDSENWSRVMRVNVDANLTLLREAHPLLKLAPNGGRVVINASKNVPAPGPGAAAYSASKAALTQLARVAALEWGADSIRVNIIHPDAVFDTGLWANGVLEARAESYGLSTEAYKTKNILRAEVSSHDVATMAAALCGQAFARTTGAQIPVDGGNDRVI